jgi:Na+-translocating ferredoxin:NAD+ oxidoreductase RnfA subunit
MTGLFALWLPIPLSAVVVVVVSSVIHRVTAFVGYAVALWQMSIWFRRAWSTTIKATVDGLIYALLTAGVFGWPWPR